MAQNYVEIHFRNVSTVDYRGFVAHSHSWVREGDELHSRKYSKAYVVVYKDVPGIIQHVLLGKTAGKPYLFVDSFGRGEDVD
jgi:hypothetical protein